MYVGVGKMTMVAPGARSLKEKRSIVRRIKDRVGHKFHVAVAEIGAQDSWQRIVLGYAVASGDYVQAESMARRIAAFIAGMGQGEVLADERDVLQVGDELGRGDEMRSWAEMEEEEGHGRD